jgi:hypothetical protein
MLKSIKNLLKFCFFKENNVIEKQISSEPKIKKIKKHILNKKI